MIQHWPTLLFFFIAAFVMLMLLTSCCAKDDDLRPLFTKQLIVHGPVN